MKTVGLFDSGVGGLTCLKTLVKKYPGNKFVYLGDTARLPYGTKSQDTIKKYTLQNIETLKGFGVDMIISACHSASSAILLQNITTDIPLFEVITPACSQVAHKKESVGILATATTVNSAIYSTTIQIKNDKTLVTQQACPLLVSLVETGWIEDPITNLVIQRYLKPLLDQKVEAIVLGCTHFPALFKQIQNVVGPAVQLIDPAEALAESLNDLLTPTIHQETQIEAHLTDISPHFVSLANELIAGDQPLQIQQI